MSPKIFVLILNYKKYLDTVRCIRSLLASDLSSFTNIIVLDNSPDPASFQYLSAHFPKIKMIKNPGNLGFAAGNNVGIRFALKQKATHILILNPDTKVPRHFLTPLLLHMNQSKAQLIAPALIHTQNGQKFFGLEGSVNPVTGQATHVNLSRLPTQDLRPAQFVTFACVLIKSTVFRKIGLLDESYFMYLEDVDFCLKANKASFRLYLDPSVTVKHNTSSSFTKPTNKLLISFKSQLTFINTWIPLPQKIIALVYNIFFYPYLYLLWTYHYYKRRS